MMKCHIAQNGGFIFLIIFLWVSFTKGRNSPKVYTIQGFCSENSYIHNIEVGDSYKLILKSDPTAAADKWYQKSKRKCLREYKTSDPSAHIIVDINDMNIPSCSECRCNYFEISVQEYKKKYCGVTDNTSFSSKSDTISVDFFHGFTMGFDVTLTFTVERNFYVIVGTPTVQRHGAGSSYLETPYFPSSYPLGYGAEYLLRSEDLKSHVVLLFLDFQISNHSFVEVEGNNGTYPTRFYGSTFRPPVIVSQFNQLNVKFQSSNELVRPGFRALTSFIRTVDSLSVPYTDCGGFKHGRGGSMNIATHETFSLYDCVWHITLPFVSSTRSNLSIAVDLRDIGHKSNLEFRNGHNSKSELISDINCESENCTVYSNELTVPAPSDLYIRFSGYLDSYSEVIISYCTYHTGDCSDREFTCEDGRCLLLEFRCDGVKQCPKGDDEQQCSTTATPNREATSTPSSQQRSIQERQAVYRIFFFVLLVGSFGLIGVVVALVTVYVLRKQRQASVGRQRPRVVNTMPGRLPTLHPGCPYFVDSPPSYEDFMKSSECYPPLLFTRPKRCILPKDPCLATSCTTSFSCRHASSSSNDRSRNSSRETCSNMFSEASADDKSISRAEASSAACGGRHIQRWYSLDSKLNDLVKQNSCHLFLSIIHPVCEHAAPQHHITRVQCHSLPSNFKISTDKCSRGDLVQLREPVWLPSAAAADRRCSWAYGPPSLATSELLTVAKARCCSDPCQGMCVHYSE